MSPREIPEGMVECIGDARGFHEKLPCAGCGKHAGGCLYPLVPESRCPACKRSFCTECMPWASERITKAMPGVDLCPECRKKALKAAFEEYAQHRVRRAWGRGFVWGVLVGGGVMLGCMVLQAMRVGVR